MIVWIASYPRSGNTFFRVLLNSIFNINTYSIYDDRFDIGADKKTAEVVGHKFLPDDFCLEGARNSDELFLIKTHDAPSKEMLEDRVVYLYRDGREASKSYLNFKKEYSHENITLDDVIAGNVQFGSWGEHVTSWDPINRKNTLLVKFEDLISNPEALLERIGEFLDIVAVGNAIPTFDELKIINPKFFNSGKKNSWEKTYTKDQELYFNCKNRVLLDQLDYHFNSTFAKKREEPMLLMEYFETWLHENKNLREINDTFSKNLHDKEQEMARMEQQFSSDLEEGYKLIEYKNADLIKIQVDLEHKNADLDKHKKQVEDIQISLTVLEKQIEKKSEIIEEKNHQLLINENSISTLSSALGNIRLAFEEITSISLIFSPIKKIKGYKKLLLAYRNQQKIINKY